MPTEKTLSDIMEFDHVIRVNEDGTIEEVDDAPYPPTMLDDNIDSSKWELISTGYTGQYGYSGPTMHPSEQLSGFLETRILSEPGVYVALVSYSTPDEDDPVEEDYAAGWGVAKLREKD